MLPFQAGGTGLGEEPDLAASVDYLPMLSGVVEFDMARPGDFQPAKFMEAEQPRSKDKGRSRPG